MLQCQTCFGTYAPIGADGIAYYHACPPLSQPEIQLAIVRGLIVLAKDETLPQAMQRRSYPRSMKRDENLAVVGELPQLVAVGRGVLTVDAAAIPVLADVPSL